MSVFYYPPRAADNTVGSSAIVDDAVTAAKIAANAVGSSELADNAVDTAAIVDDAVTAAKIAANAVGASELADNAVDTAAIADDAVTAAKIAANAVGSSEIAANAVGASELGLQGIVVVKPTAFSVASNGGVGTVAPTFISGASDTFETNTAIVEADDAAGRIYARVAGLFRVSGAVYLTINAGGTVRIVKLQKNGATYATLNHVPASANANGLLPFVPRIVSLAVNDYLTFLVVQDSAGALMTIATDSAAIAVEYLGPAS